jgi:hypothetical protein
MQPRALSLLRTMRQAPEAKSRPNYLEALASGQLDR